MLVLAGLIAARSPLPYTAVAVIPLVWAGVEMVLSMRAWSAAAAASQTATPTAAQTGAGARRPAFGLASGIIGLLLVCLLTLTVLLPYAFYGTVKNLQDCTLGANTAIATRDCNARYNRDLDPALRDLLRIGQPAGG
jgi:hypothetical protein